jgi:hypothetical protein
MSLFRSSDPIFATVSGDEMVGVVRDLGFSSELATDSGGDPMIRFQVEGMKCLLLFYGCKDGRASSIQFSAGFTMKRPLELINKWNQKKRFGKAYLDADGDVMINFDVDLDGGVTREYLKEVFKRWRAVFISFVTFLQE